MDNKNNNNNAGKNNDQKAKKPGFFKRAKAKIAGFSTKHPKISKAGKITGKVIGAGCTVFTVACGASVINDRRARRNTSAPAESTVPAGESVVTEASEI
jgi:hypothetical protein